MSVVIIVRKKSKKRSQESVRSNAQSKGSIQESRTFAANGTYRRNIHLEGSSRWTITQSKTHIEGKIGLHEVEAETETVFGDGETVFSET